jgi:pilus assembly protein CpaE
MKCIIIGPDPDLGKELEQALLSAGGVTVCRRFEEYPPVTQIPGCLRSQEIEVVFVDLARRERAIEIAKFLECEKDGVQTIAFTAAADSAGIREAMRAGIREYLVRPFEENAVLECLMHTNDLLARRSPQYSSTDEIFAFLPAKPGVGASTLAVNIASAVAEQRNERVLLADFDLGCGIVQFMLKIANDYSVLDALENSMKLEERLWADLVTPRGGLDVLHAGKINPNLRIDPGQINALVRFARRLYGTLCFDLSGHLDRPSLEVLNEAKRIFLVTTPEIPALHLAKAKLSFLRERDLDSKVQVLLNRSKARTAFNQAAVEEVLGQAAAWTFANDYVGVTNAVREATCVVPTSDLGRQVQEFASALGDHAAFQTKSNKKFLNFFTVPRTPLARKLG